MKSPKKNPVKPSVAAKVIEPLAAVRHPLILYWKQWLAGLVVAFIAAFAVYQPAINGPFLFDDRYLPFMSPGYANAPLIAWLRGVRPMLMFSFWMNYRISSIEPYSYHLLNLVLHFFNCILTGVILKKILHWAGVGERSGIILSIFGAGIFLLHPLQTESVTYVASRSENLSLFFFFAAFAVFVWRRSIEVTWLTAAAILTLFGAAVTVKEHTVALPALLLLTDYFWNPGFTLDGIKKNWRLYLPIAVGGALGVVVVLRVLGAADTAGFKMKDLTWYQYFFTQCRVIWLYLRFYIFPFGQNIDPDFPISRNVFDHLAIVGMLALIAAAIAAWIYRRKYPLAAYGFLLFLILLAPTSSFVPIKDVVAERRMYLPFLGLILMTLEVVRRWHPGTGTLVAALLAVLAAEGAVTYNRNQVWSNSVSLWQDTVNKSPAKARPRFQLAYAFFQEGQCALAAQEYSNASKLQAPDFGLLVDWALAEDCAGNSALALEKLQQAAKLERSAHVFALLGMVYGKAGNRADSLAALDTAIQLDPRFDMTYVYRGNVYAGNQENAAAAEEYQKALAINPSNQSAQAGLQMVSRK